MYKSKPHLLYGCICWFLRGLVGGVGGLSLPYSQGPHAKRTALVGALATKVLPGREVPPRVQHRVQYSSVPSEG